MNEEQEDEMWKEQENKNNDEKEEIEERAYESISVLMANVKKKNIKLPE